MGSSMVIGTLGLGSGLGMIILLSCLIAFIYVCVFFYIQLLQDTLKD